MPDQRRTTTAAADRRAASRMVYLIHRGVRCCVVRRLRNRSNLIFTIEGLVDFILFLNSNLFPRKCHLVIGTRACEKKIFVHDCLGIYLYRASVLCHFTSSTLVVVVVCPDTNQCLLQSPRGSIPIIARWREKSLAYIVISIVHHVRLIDLLCALLVEEIIRGEERVNSIVVVALICETESTCAQCLSSFVVDEMIR